MMPSTAHVGDTASAVEPAAVDRELGPVREAGRLAWVRDEHWRDAHRLASRFAAGVPFPHVVLEEFLEAERAEDAAAAFPRVDESWIRFTHINERKFGNPAVATFPAPLRALVAELASPPFVAWLSTVTGIPGLRPDPDLCGGGLHQTQRGGFLNIHTDFSCHPLRSKWRRAVNLVLFLNPGWSEGYGGALELWPSDMSRCAARIVPRLNTCVIFQVGRETRHGHPDRLACPPDRARNSLALYYFTEEAEPPARHATTYFPRPGDGARGVLIRAENLALRAFDALRRRGWVTDEAIGRVLARLQR